MHVSLGAKAFATGFSVDDATRENYSVTLSHAQEVDRSELAKALRPAQLQHGGGRERREEAERREGEGKRSGGKRGREPS